jgi:ComF family protein
VIFSKTNFRGIGNLLQDSLNDFVGLIYPETCCCCGSALTKVEFHICLSCDLQLPLVADQKIIMHKFAGKLPFYTAFSLYQYRKQNSIQNIFDEIKYRDNQELAIFMGERLGSQIDFSVLADYDGLVPVPLHISRMKYRGYNQSELLAKGVSEVTGLPVLTDLLYRNMATSTQTLKQRFDRWRNVSSVFEANDKVKGMKLILLDDVLTTGATLVSCAESLLRKNTAEVSFVSLASAV